MKLRWKLGIAIPITLFAVGAVCWFTITDFRFWVREAYFLVRPVPRLCKQRAADFGAREERIRAEAKASLKPGTKKADVISFFTSEKMSVDFYQIAEQHEASGEIYIKGLAECADIACGDDSALIGVRVDVDENGTVLSVPVVVGMETDCL
jgi:hypothetical protein